MRSGLVSLGAGLCGCFAGVAYAGPAGAQTPACAQLRQDDTIDTVEALADRNPAKIRSALAALLERRRLRDGTDRFNGRRPRRASYNLKFSDRQLAVRARALVADVERSAWWLQTPPVRTEQITRPLHEIADTVRNLLAVARAFPDETDAALGLAARSGDYLLSVSRDLKFSGAPLPAARWIAPGDRFFRMPSRADIRTCPALLAASKRAMFVAPRAPELHYAETAGVAMSLIRLSQAVDSPAYANWARDASDWSATLPISADPVANAAIAAMNAELYILTAEKKFFDRAIDWMTHGILPAFEAVEGKAGGSAQRLAEGLLIPERAAIAHHLVRIVTAIATTPAGTISLEETMRSYRSARDAIKLAEERVILLRRLQVPAVMLEMALDIRRARLAGAVLRAPEAEVLRHVLAHGADRAKRYIVMPRAASGRFLEALASRAWNGAYRKPAIPAVIQPASN